MATAAEYSGMGPPTNLAALLPVLLDEISRLKQLHTLAGTTELPVCDAVVRRELAQLRADFAQIKSLFGVAGATISSNKAAKPEASAREDAKAPAAFGQAHPPAESRPAARPRLDSVNVSGDMLPLPEGCETHFFLSHFQATGSDQVATLELELQRLGFSSW